MLAVKNPIIPTPQLINRSLFFSDILLTQSLTSLTMADNGNYTCLVSNNTGSIDYYGPGEEHLVAEKKQKYIFQIIDLDQ